MCRQTSFGGKTHSQCIRPHGLDGLTTVFAYRGVIRKAIKKLKYKFVSDLAKDLKVENKKVWLYNKDEVEQYLKLVGTHNPRLLKYQSN